MTFFYDLNKRLQQALETPKSEHKQLNEGTVTELSDKKLAAYQDKAQKQLDRGENVAKRTAGVLRTSHSARRNKGLDPYADTANLKNYPLGEEGMEEGLGNVAKKVGSALKAGAKAVGKAIVGKDDDELLKDLQKKAGIPAHAQHGKKNMAQSNEAAEPMSPKQKKFAALAEPKDKITFADKIAGAKKEVDEMLGDVAAKAMKDAITSKGGTVTKTKGGIKHSAGPGVYGGSDKDTHPLDRMKGPSKKRLTGKGDVEEGWDDMMKAVKDRADKPKVGSVERGHKHDIEHTATGRRVTRRVDDQGHSVGADDDETTKADAPKRGRGRPKGTGGKMGAKGPSGKSKLMTKEAEHDSAEVKQAMALLKKAGYKVEKAQEELEEKAVSKKQQKFMGMVHAAQKGEKPASKEVAKVAKEMPKKAAKDFAATKHKGLPEKKKPEGKKKEKTEEAGGSGTPTASSGFSYGKGIYDSMNRDLEDMIAESMARLDSTLNESMSVNMSSSTEGGKSLSITATEEDALKLAAILKMAGLGGDHEGLEQDHGVVPNEGGCGCDTSPCSCDGGSDEVEVELDEVDENQPDYPTDAETSDDAMQYSGGLNGPKSTGQTTVPVIASQEERQGTYAEAEEDAIKRMMEMAGIKEGKKPDFLDVDKDGNKKESFKKAVDDKEKDKVDEGILAATRNLWKTYQPK